MTIRFVLIIFFAVILICGCKTTDEKDVDINEIIKKQIDENYNYNELEKHMRGLFNLIEKWIAQGNFESWYNSISRKYKYFLNNPANLKKITDESDYLFNRSFVIKSSRDYFKYVVVESREGYMLKFEGYKYINNNHVKVFCLFDKNDKFVYDFIYEEGKWKVDR